MVSDAQLMLSQARQFSRTNPALPAIINNTEDDLRNFNSLSRAVSSGDAEVELIAMSAQRIMSGCRALCTALQL